MKPTVTLSWKFLGFAAMIGIGAILAIMPSRLAGASLETRIADYAAAIPAEGHAVAPATLASWLASAKPMALVDVREHWEYDEWHLEGAEHRPLRELLSPETIKSLPTDRPVVVVGRNGAAPGQAVAVLRLAGLDAYVLDGGLESFWRTVLLPASLDGSIPDSDRPTLAARRTEWRAKLLGAGSATADSVPTTQAPATPPTAPTGKPSKSAAARGKGC
jgi:rhodanese-related sulfurtransferase